MSLTDLSFYKGGILLDGAFDPLHAGHVAYVQAAFQAFPHRVPRVVAVASDDDIRAKGREPLLPHASRMAVVRALAGVDAVYAKAEPTEDVIAAMRPMAYVKGADWKGRLPATQMAACAAHGVEIVYLNTAVDSSTARLRRWALADADRSLARLERFMAAQRPAGVPWQPVTDYSFEARKAIEGRHPELIRDVFQPVRVLDVGCGPGHLVRLLREIGIEAHGCDVHPPDGPHYFRDDVCSDAPLPEWDTTPLEYDLVICREVLEHLTVSQVAVAVRNLFRLSSRYVYITTRFASASVFDAATECEVDPTHITCLSQPFLRALCVVNGGQRRADLEQRLDWMQKGRCLVYEL